MGALASEAEAVRYVTKVTFARASTGLPQREPADGERLLGCDNDIAESTGDAVVGALDDRERGARDLLIIR